MRCLDSVVGNEECQAGRRRHKYIAYYKTEDKTYPPVTNRAVLSYEVVDENEDGIFEPGSTFRMRNSSLSQPSLPSATQRSIRSIRS